jgi:choline transport protein
MTLSKPAFRLLSAFQAETLSRCVFWNLIDKLTNHTQRYINLSSVVYFDIIALCSWEGLALTFQFALLNGGPSSLVYGGIFVCFGGIAVALSMAEMASM